MDANDEVIDLLSSLPRIWQDFGKLQNGLPEERVACRQHCVDVKTDYMAE